LFEPYSNRPHRTTHSTSSATSYWPVSPEDQHQFALRDQDTEDSRSSKAIYSSLDRLDGMGAEKVTGIRHQIVR
jgi:hypothetical protein